MVCDVIKGFKIELKVCKNCVFITVTEKEGNFSKFQVNKKCAGQLLLFLGQHRLPGSCSLLFS